MYVLFKLLISHQLSKIIFFIEIRIPIIVLPIIYVMTLLAKYNLIILYFDTIHFRSSIMLNMVFTLFEKLLHMGLIAAITM